MWNWIRRLMSPSVHHRSHRVLEVEGLEDRIVPIIGATAIPAEILPGGKYDGVVRIVQGEDNGTGSLFQIGNGRGSGHYILTAAHVVADPTKDALVTFRLLRPADGIHEDQYVSIPLTVYAGANQFQILHPDYIPYNLLAGRVQVNDIALLQLTDQEQPGVNRLLVAPFSAQSYGLYNDTNEIGQQFVQVGYGLTGTGTTGFIRGTEGTKRSGQNRFDANANILRNAVPQIGHHPIRRAGPGSMSTPTGFKRSVKWDWQMSSLLFSPPVVSKSPPGTPTRTATTSSITSHREYTTSRLLVPRDRLPITTLP